MIYDFPLLLEIGFKEIVRLVTMDMIITIVTVLFIDFFRGLWIRYCSSWWCWDIETTFVMRWQR